MPKIAVVSSQNQQNNTKVYEFIFRPICLLYLLKLLNPREIPQEA
jgi:hypothetical protein